MDFEDRITLATPEGVDLELPLAGLGSRFIATSVDWTLKGVLIGSIFFGLSRFGGEESAGDAAAASDDLSLAIGVAVFFAVVFLIALFYDVLFEVLGRGRTPGKRVAGIRVVEDGGGPVGLRASTVRNLLRLIDGLPFSYVPAMICILVTRRNQRIGDLVAGTLVVREPPRAPREPMTAPLLGHDLAEIEVSAVTQHDLATLRDFLERRPQLADAARKRLAADLASRLRPKVTDRSAPAAASDEAFLERVAAAKTRRL